MGSIRQIVIRVTLLAVGFVFAGAQSSPAETVGTYRSCHYHDLVAEPGHPLWENEARIAVASRQLFRGDKAHASPEAASHPRHSIGMVATPLATKGEVSKAFVEPLWSSPVPSAEQRHYEDMLTMMNLLRCSGQFRI